MDLFDVSLRIELKISILLKLKIDKFFVPEWLHLGLAKSLNFNLSFSYLGLTDRDIHPVLAT